jgi:hypothetical protein
MDINKVDGRGQRAKKEWYFYNKEVKDRFLDFIKETLSEKTYELYFKQLSKLSEYERKEWKDDVYNMQPKEIVDFINSTQTLSYQSRDIFRTIIRKYIQWAISQGYSKRNFDFTKMIKFDNAKSNINVNGIKIGYIKDEEELRNICTFCANAQDAVCFVLPYFSVDGEKHEEMLNLTYNPYSLEHSDVKENGVVARKNNGKERFVEIPESFLEIIKDAAGETTYYKNNNILDPGMRSNVSFEMVQSPHVIKIANKMKGYSEDGVTAQLINQRVKKIARLYDGRNLQRLNPQSVKMSGLFNLLKKMEQEKEGELERADYLEVMTKYDIAESLLPAYKAKYKLFKELV